jgi:threonyl-tRNA synthetase
MKKTSGKEKEEVVSEALKAEEKLKSEWSILDTSGKLHPLKVKDSKVVGFDFAQHPNLLKLAQYEMAKQRVYEKEPPHIQLMRKLEMVDFEKGSDPGNLRYYPNGRFVKKLLETFVSNKVVEYGGMEMESPIMYDYDHPALKSYLHRFPARQYIVESLKRKFFLRFSACFGQFLQFHDMNISYRNLPTRLYELTRYSFRLEQSGELTGLKRLRAFTMPDCHALVKDFAQGKEEMLRRFKLAQEVMSGAGFKLPDDFELAIRVVRTFYDEHKEIPNELVKRYGKPALVEMWNERFFYFAMKYEWNFIDAMDKASGLATDQFDVENGERFNINFIDEDGKKKHPIILHLSPSGAIERVIYALLEKAWMDEQKTGKAPMLPVWLSPEQVRLLPVADRHLDHVRKLADQLNNANIRTGIDDRSLTISKKVYQAKMDWIPYIIVVGDKEQSGKTIPVVVREESKTNKDNLVSMSVEELKSRIRTEAAGKPHFAPNLPRELSLRPVFVAWSEEEKK